MARKKPVPGKKLYTVAEANAALPLVRSIVRDIADLAKELQERHDRLAPLQDGKRGKLDDARREELEAQFERDKERMDEFVDELRKLGVELKDYFTGLIDFRCHMDGREVYLCWRLGEPEVGHWHELDAGFAGRRKLPPSLAAEQPPQVRPLISDL